MTETFIMLIDAFKIIKLRGKLDNVLKQTKLMHFSNVLFKKIMQTFFKIKSQSAER